MKNELILDDTVFLGWMGRGGSHFS